MLYYITRYYIIILPIAHVLHLLYTIVMAASNEGSVFSSDSEEDNSPSDQKATFSLDNWIKFSVDHQLAELIQHLRQKLYSLVLRKLVTPNKQLTHAEEVNGNIFAV